MEKTLASSRSLLLLELVSSGYFGADIGESFHTEGRAMLDAVLHDLRRIPGLRVVTPKAVVGSRGLLFDLVAQHDCDTSLIIAPEFDGLLEQFCTAATSRGGQSLNCDPSTIQLCSDKWRLHQHFESHGIATVPTRLLLLGETPPEFPCVVKPRDGAGSWLVRAVPDRSRWHTVKKEFAATGRADYLCQPVIAGRACSVAVVFGPDGRQELLPIAEQLLSTDGEYRYLGGRIPARLPDQREAAVRQLIESCLHSLSGCRGYVGFDVIIPCDGSSAPVVVEVNPRLTTSYIGYRQLCRSNLMAYLLAADSLVWREGVVTFDPNGRGDIS